MRVIEEEEESEQVDSSLCMHQNRCSFLMSHRIIGVKRNFLAGMRLGLLSSLILYIRQERESCVSFHLPILRSSRPYVRMHTYTHTDIKNGINKEKMKPCRNQIRMLCMGVQKIEFFAVLNASHRGWGAEYSE